MARVINAMQMEKEDHGQTMFTSFEVCNDTIFYIEIGVNDVTVKFHEFVCVIYILVAGTYTFTGLEFVSHKTR